MTYCKSNTELLPFAPVIVLIVSISSTHQEGLLVCPKQAFTSSHIFLNSTVFISSLHTADLWTDKAQACLF